MTDAERLYRENYDALRRYTAWLGRKFQMHPEDAEDEGQQAFMEAALTYDPERGTVFKTFMFWRFLARAKELGRACKRREILSPYPKTGLAETKPFDLGKLADRLGRDAVTLLEAVPEVPGEVIGKGEGRRGKNKTDVIGREFRSWFRDRTGWPPNRVKAAFREVRELVTAS